MQSRYLLKTVNIVTATDVASSIRFTEQFLFEQLFNEIKFDNHFTFKKTVRIDNNAKISDEMHFCFEAVLKYLRVVDYSNLIWYIRDEIGAILV